MKTCLVIIAALDFAGAIFAPRSWKPNRPMLVLLGVAASLWAISLG